MYSRAFYIAFSVFFLSLILVAGSGLPVSAQTPDQIRQQIADHNAKIKALDAEIAQYQKQLSVLNSQHATLATTIKSLDTQKKALTTKIASLQRQIGKLNLELKQLAGQIQTKEKEISLSQKALAQSLRDIYQADTDSVIEQVFSSDDLGTAWAVVDAKMALNSALRDQTRTLAQVKQELTEQQQAVSETQSKLVLASKSLGTQKSAVEVTAAEKNKLLAQTKSQESAYQKLIETKRAQQKAFESALSSLESSLKSISTGSIPKTGAGILAWPASPHPITQYFGKTAFAASGAYNGAGHNGIDIGIPTGTPITAALSGTVYATGNTDAYPGCYSFGKWVMVQHANGLSTMYAHLSSISVSKGQSVATGDTLGFSGMTGYATGPHLHFSVYASAGVQITTLRAARGASTPCAGAPIPVAPLNAYLNPMSYL